MAAARKSTKRTVTSTTGAKPKGAWRRPAKVMVPPAEPSPSVRLPIDYFFRSLAEDQKYRAVGIILSGTATDGMLGLRAIKAESGMTIAQEPQSSKYRDMPRNAMAVGVVDVVQPAGQMSGPLRVYARNLTRLAPPLPERDVSQPIHKIFLVLRDRTGNDCAVYQENTIHRRIERWIHVHQIENVRQSLRFVLANPAWASSSGSHPTESSRNAAGRQRPLMPRHQTYSLNLFLKQGTT